MEEEEFIIWLKVNEKDKCHVKSRKNAMVILLKN